MWYNDYVLLREEIKNMSILLDNMKKKLNENQFEVATHTTGPAVVMAGERHRHLLTVLHIYMKLTLLQVFLW